MTHCLAISNWQVIGRLYIQFLSHTIFWQLNSQCLRQTHHCHSQLQLVCQILPNNKKIISNAPDEHIIRPSTSICCSLGCQICCLQVFNLSLSIVCVCLIYFSLQPLHIATWIKFLLSQLNGTLISNFSSTVLKACSIPSLMCWQQRKLLPQFFTPKIELLGKKELLHNILPKFGACS